MNYRKWFYILNASLLAAFAVAYIKDYNAEWKKWQKGYYKRASEDMARKAAEAKDPEQKKIFESESKRFKSAPLEIKQIIAKDLGRMDRCITCHVGMDEYTNPTLKNDFKEHPFKAHPQVDGPLGKKHAFSKYGCTVCHQGQGLATTSKDAHGKVHNWEQPLLPGKMVQASCVQCHQNNDKLPGAEFAIRGKQLFYKHGCQGCHSINGVGGVISVDLRDIADKPLESIAGYNFAKIVKDGKPLAREDWNVQNWILGHLINDPIQVTPNDPFAKYNAEPVAPSGMPDYTKELSREDAEAITTWLMSKSAKPLPHTFTVPMSPAPEPIPSDRLAFGKYVYNKYGCQGCHGLDAKQGRRNYNARGPGQEDPHKDMDKGMEPTLPDIVGTYTKEELIKKIANGVPSSAIDKFNPEGPTPPLYMPPWKDKIKPHEMDALADWLLSIAKKDESGF